MLGLAMMPGCGYALAGRGSFLPSYIRVIGIPTFANRTTIFNLETLLTEKVRAEFIGRGKYQILPSPDGVDALLTGEVTGVSIQPSSFSNNQIASRYTLTMSARITAPADATEDQLRELALADPAVQTHAKDKTIRKVVIGKGPIVSVVVA